MLRNAAGTVTATVTIGVDGTVVIVVTIVTIGTATATVEVSQSRKVRPSGETVNTARASCLPPLGLRSLVFTLRQSADVSWQA